MQIYLEERIGKPELFTGRKREPAEFLKWIDGVKEKISKSTAILSRRKTGKTALLERLYNLTFEQHGRVVPFYFEIRETNQWVGDFAKEFFLTFLSQYAAFHTRNPEYLRTEQIVRLEHVHDVCEQEHVLTPFRPLLKGMLAAAALDGEGMWEIARETPGKIAASTDERVVQMIDEFQFLNRHIYWDQDKTRHAKGLVGSYLHTAERKHAPLLITGSWVGWLIDDVNKLLPGRVVYAPLNALPEEEAVEMIVNYSLIEHQPVTEATTYLIADLSEGSLFYMSALFHSRFPEKDLTTPEGVRRTLEFETLHLDGSINSTWMEYLDAAFDKVNDVYAKDMMLYLSKHRHEFVSRKALKAQFQLDMTDAELEKKLKALYRSDIIAEHYGRYRGVQDNIFDKVFRCSYADDIDTFVTTEAPEEYKALFDDILTKYKSLQGTYNRYKGAFAELVICHHLRYHAFTHPDIFLAMLHNLPKEAKAFVDQAQALIRLEQVEKAVLCVFSAGGFYKNTLEYLAAHQITYSDDARWLEYHLVG